MAGELVCGDCGGEVRSRSVYYPQRTGGFVVMEHWTCATEVADIKSSGRRRNPTHRVRVEVGFVERGPA